MAEAAPCLFAESQQLCISLPESHTKQAAVACGPVYVQCIKVNQYQREDHVHFQKQNI